MWNTARLLILCLLVCNQAWAAKDLCVRYPSGTALECYTPTNPPPGSTINWTDSANALYTGWTTSGASVWVTTSANNVGIGTSVPTQKLQVAGNIAATNLSGSNTGDQTCATTSGCVVGAITSSYYTAGSGIGIGTTGVITNTSPGITYTAGSGISIGTTNVISNTAPDQTVSIGTTGTGLAVTGTYPNFTIQNTSPGSTYTAGGNIGISTANVISNLAPDQTVSIGTTGTGIAISGTYPNFTLTGSGGSASQWLTNGASIGTTGAVGIGSTAPRSMLDVVGTVYATNLYSSGNVGIGTSSPTSNIQISGSSPISASINSTSGQGGCDSYSVLLSHYDAGLDDSNCTGGGVKTGTTVGNVGIGTTHPKFGTNSLVVNGSSQYVTYPDSADWTYGTGDFTIDFWIYPTSLTGTRGLVTRYVDGTHYDDFQMFSSGRIQALFRRGGSDFGNINTAAGQEVLINTWTHVAIERYGNTAYLYLNGVKKNTVDYTGINIVAMTSTERVGYDQDAGGYFAGYIDEVRISKGIARYKGVEFTPPTQPYDALSPSSASQLILQTNSSQAAKVWTDTNVLKFDVPSTTRMTIDVGGNVGIGTSIPNATLDLVGAGTTSATATLNVHNSAQGQSLIVLGNNNVGIGSSMPQSALDVVGQINASTNILTLGNVGIGTSAVPANKLGVYGSVSIGTGYPASAAPTNGLIVQGNVGLGTSVPTQALSVTGNQTVTGNVGIGTTAVGNGLTVQGTTYAIGNVGIGTSVPTDSLYISSAVGGATLNFVPAGQGGCDASTVSLFHYDSNLNGDSNCIGGGAKTGSAQNGAAISSVQSEFGGSSLLLTKASTQYVSYSDSDDWDFGSGDFTIDVWVKLSAGVGNGDNYIVSQDEGTRLKGWHMAVQADGAFSFTARNGGTFYFTETKNTPFITDTNWHHIAVVRSSGTPMLFLDGVKLTLDGSSNGTMINFAGSLLVGCYLQTDGSPLSPFGGYIDELRISKGIARWTNTFTPPSRAYDNLSIVSTPSLVFKGSGTQTAKVWTDGNNADAFKVDVASTTRMTVLSGGNVGIGSTAPRSALDVVGTVTATSYSGSGAALTGVLTSNPIYVSGSNVGIGTSAPIQKLDVSGTLRVGGTGNVGIGTTAPLQKLEIGGSGSKIKMYSPNGGAWSCGPADTTGVFTCT